MSKIKVGNGESLLHKYVEQQLWAVIKELRVFTVREIAAEIRKSQGTTRVHLRKLVDNGKLNQLQVVGRQNVYYLPEATAELKKKYSWWNFEILNL